MDRTLDAERAPPRGQHPALPEPHLLVALECDRPEALSSRHRLGAGGIARIGRGPTRSVRRAGDYRGVELDLTIPDRRMSSRHAEVRGAGGIWIISDVGSRNGVRVNGTPVRERTLRDGDLIELGHTLLLFRALANSHAQPDVDWETETPSAPGLRTLVPDLAERFRRLQQMTHANLPVLITGETGTGKEVTARAVHALSGVAGRFVGVNCGAIPATLIEGELFGSTKGAFSGAVADRPGLIREAHGGTLFLDEIGDLPLGSQTAFLRVLQERRVRPVGGQQDVAIDVGLVSATNQDVEQLVRDGSFRQDLFARIAGFRIRLPPLRERKEDLGLLIGQVLSRLRSDARPTLSVEAARHLFAYDFPLNIRELENWLTSAVAFADGAIGVEHFPDPIDLEPQPSSGNQSLRPSTRPLTDEQERHKDEVVSLLRQHSGNVSAVARATGKARNQVQRWIRRYSLRAEDYR